ncbi:MAG: dimethylarginine dimethylaminohydrolase [Hellea sp.]|nr:dimethylarginine dimethylaminohydrolase [Hellea sp.]
MSVYRSYHFTHALCREPANSVTNGLRLDLSENPHPELLLRQHKIYIEALNAAGVTVNIMPAQEDFPDSVFVEDAALVLDGVAILLNPGAESRAGEPKALVEDGAQYFKNIIQTDLTGPIDGGDILAFDDVIFAGLSDRTSQAGADDLAKLVDDFGYELRTVTTPKDILHFKTHSSLLDERTALATPSLAASGCFDGFEVVTSPENEPQGANVIRVNDKIIMSAEAPETAKMLGAMGFDVLTVPTSEVAKIDGAVSCCSLRYSL